MFDFQKRKIPHGPILNFHLFFFEKKHLLIPFLQLLDHLTPILGPADTSLGQPSSKVFLCQKKRDNLPFESRPHPYLCESAYIYPPNKTNEKPTCRGCVATHFQLGNSSMMGAFGLILCRLIHRCLIQNSPPSWGYFLEKILNLCQKSPMRFFSLRGGIFCQIVSMECFVFFVVVFFSFGKHHCY